MKKSKKELQETADKIYFAKSTVNAMLATEDGNFFYPQDTGAAAAHAASIGGEVHILERPKDLKAPDGAPEYTGRHVAPQKDPKPTPSASQKDDKKDAPATDRPSAKKTAAMIKEVESLEALEELAQKLGLADDERKTVQDAYEAKHKELSESAPTSEELIEKINAAETEDALDALDAAYDLSKTEDDAVRAAFEAKENAFIDQE